MKGKVELRVGITTIVLVILLLISCLGRCVLDWIELRDEWWDMIDTEEDENVEVNTGGENE